MAKRKKILGYIVSHNTSLFGSHGQVILYATKSEAVAARPSLTQSKGVMHYVVRVVAPVKP